MCGITGIWSKKQISSSCIEDITSPLKHRGPDDEGYLAVDTLTKTAHLLTGPDSQIKGIRLRDFQMGANLFLGHRRLSILDLSERGHQPMANPQGTQWIVLNGEIFNYLELRDQLRSAGCIFNTQTDTEVLLAAYDQWGMDCLDRLDGMWAFAIYDKNTNTLCGARDRFGVKPFYYLYDGKLFAFASEIKALLKHRAGPIGINDKAAFEYLVFGRAERGEEGMFQGIRELQPSHSFRLDCTTGELCIQKYYSLPVATDVSPYDPHEASRYADNIRSQIGEAVSSHLQADVQVGSCLSGGLDSSTIVCFINRILDKDHPHQVGEFQKTYTICYEESGIDESRWAKFVVDRTKTEWHRVIPHPDEIAASLEDIVYTQDIPFLSTSVISQYLLMKTVRETGTKVLLDGQGGDELFAGYKGHFVHALMDLAKRLAAGSMIHELLSLRNSTIGPLFLLNSLAKTYLPKLMPQFILRSYLRRSRTEVRYLNADFLSEYGSGLLEHQERRAGSLNQVLFETMTGADFKYLLRFEDRNSMRHSVEARTPFADSRRLIEECFKIPGAYKIHNGWSKYLLRMATQGILPREVQWRKDKLGFPTPETQWLLSLKTIIFDHLHGDISRYIDISRLQKEYDSRLASNSNYSPSLWRMINFAVWKNVFCL